MHSDLVPQTLVHELFRCLYSYTHDTYTHTETLKILMSKKIKQIKKARAHQLKWVNKRVKIK